MSQPAYDSAKHHVGLGPSGSQVGLMVSGGYRRGPQHDQGGPTEFGGDQDVGFLPGHSRWTQDDFTGGQYQDVWSDPAMFHHCEGFRPLPYSRSLVTVQKGAFTTDFDGIPYTFDSGSNLSTLGQPATVFAHKGWIHFVYAAYQIVLALDTREAGFGTWVLSDLTDGMTNVAAFHRETSILYTADDGDEKLCRWVFNATTGAWTAAGVASYSYPDAVGTRSLIGMNADGPRITCAFQGLLADLTPPDNSSGAVGGASKQWAVNKRYKLPSLWRSSLFFNSQLYILLNDEFNPEFPNFPGETGWTTQILAWDGSDLYPIVDFPYVFRGRTLCEYGGRVFVAGESQDLGGSGNGSAEIFEVTGSSLRSVRSWGADRRSSATDIMNHGPTILNSLLVYEGLLWFYNDSTQRAECYDITTDAFYGGPLLEASSSAGEHDYIYRLIPLGNTIGLVKQATTVDDLIGTIPAPPDGYNLHLTWSWRGQEDGGSQTFTDTHVLMTSDFAHEPSRDKKLTEVVVLSKLAAPSMCEGSVDGGDTYSELTQISTSAEGNWHVTHYDATALDPAKRFRLMVSFETDEAGVLVELHSITTLFTMQPSGKKAWSFTVLGPERIEGLDHETVLQDIPDLASSLFDWHQTGETLVFNDIDNAAYNVRVDDVEENAVEIGPDVEFASGTRPEAHYSVTLIEV